MVIWMSGASSMFLIWTACELMRQIPHYWPLAVTSGVVAGVVATLGMMASGAFTWRVEKIKRKQPDDLTPGTMKR